MSNKQGQTKDFDTLEAERQEARQRTAARLIEEEERKNKLQANREKAQKKLKEALKKKNAKSTWDLYSYQITFGVLGGLLLIVIVSQVFGMGRNLSTIPVLEDEFIRRINEEGRGFKARANTFFEGWTLSDVQKILSNGITNSNKLNKCASETSSAIVEESFNFAKQHRFCGRPITNQKNCSSSYAWAATGMFSDRYCKINNGLKKYEASVQHAIACDTKGSQGCKGGYITGTLELGKAVGFVTPTCMPYNTANADTCDLERLKTCFRRKVDNYCVSEGAEAIKREIQLNGPVASIIPVTREFLVYGGGVYDVNAESYKLQGGQAVKVVGWGTNSAGVEYWIIENSWGESWGIKGYAKVKMGIDGSFLDKFAVAVTPDNGDVVKSN